jgi:integrase
VTAGAFPKQSRTRPLSRAGIALWFGRCVEAAGLAGYTMHQLRHAAIDDIRRATGDLEITRLLARHKNVQVTQDYLHTGDVNELRAAIEDGGERCLVALTEGTGSTGCYLT